MEKSKIISNFYKDYRKLHFQIFENINIKESEEIKHKYITVFFNRIMILFFLEKEKYLDNNINFLEENLYEYKKKNNDFHLFFEKLCFNCLGEKKKINTKYKVPYINGSFFKKNNLDVKYKGLYISNENYEFIFKTFNKYEWGLKENTKKNCISPDILGNIFEKYINQKQMGAYYTDADTTNYISKNVLCSSLLNEINKKSIFNLEIKNLIENNKDILELILELINDENILEIILKFMLGQNDNKLTVIDPTCGSGAFIFSALNILEDILEKSYHILEKNEIKSSYLNDLFNEIKTHKNYKYFIVKEIIRNNLFGVDIDEEAVEIVKLRLYLKLLSLVDDSAEIEIFPNLDKNFFHGNSLIGEVSNININININKQYKGCFHWSIHFKKILDSGGFDCIIGNPPYIEYSKIKEYEVNNISTLKCGNLYSFIIERSIQILKKDGFCGMIVPISIVATPRMKELRNFLFNNSKYIFFSNFADRPGCLFKGVHQKLTIFINQKSDENNLEIFTTDYIHWYSQEERFKLFNQIKYYKNNFNKVVDSTILKIGNNTQENILKKIFSVKKSILENVDKNGPYKIFLNMRLTFWVKCFYIKKLSKEYKNLYFEKESEAKVFVALFNSSLFFMFWEIASDNWHITNKELKLFKFDYMKLDESTKKTLVLLADKLEEDLEINKRYIGSKQVEYEYVHKYSKHIINQIDEILGNYYNFTKEEIEYIKNYNLKYRIGEKI